MMSSSVRAPREGRDGGTTYCHTLARLATLLLAPKTLHTENYFLGN